jgi:NTE family protein
MGAVVGGMYSAGFLPQYREWLLRQTKSDIYRLFDITLSMQGFVKGEKIFSVLEQLAGKQNIEDLPIPLVVVASDIISRTEIHFRTGDLYKALRATTGMPGIFKPIMDKKSLFVDGGVLNPLPVDIPKRHKDCMVVAVHLNGAIYSNVPTGDSPPKGKIPEIETDSKDMVSRLRKYISTTMASHDTPKEPPMPSFSMFEILEAAYDATLARLTEVMLKAHPADLLIEIPRNTASSFEFYRSAELIEIGRKAYDKATGKHQPEAKTRIIEE